MIDPTPLRPAAQATTTACRLPFGDDILVIRASYRNQRFSRHAHDGYALGVIEAGALAFRYRGCQVVAPAGSVSLAQPGVPHDGAAAVPEGWRYRMLYLPEKALAPVLPEGAPPPHFRPGVIEDPWLATLIARTHRVLLAPEPGLLAKQTLLLALLATWIGRHADAPPVTPSVGREPRAVRLVLTMLEEHFAENPSLDDLAEAVGLSPWYLARVVTLTTGLPPHAHLLEFRLRNVRARLAGPQRLADIAALVGFADQSHLSRAFRARFGLTPGAYRKIVQNTAAASR